ncbi:MULTISPECIES: class I SAM-dependent methyltransferase [unclassified Butyrivibrio]
MPFGDGIFDAAVSVESLHHFSKEEKIPLYLECQNKCILF